MRAVISTVAAFLSLAAISQAQQGGPPRPGLPPPQARVYDHVFRQINGLEKAADDADVKGNHGKANGYRKHFQNKFGLKDNEATVLKGHAKALAQKLANQDKKAADIIQRERKKFPGGRMPKGQKPPAAPPELDGLWTERTQMITDEVDGLKRDLGADTFSKLDKFAQNQYAAVKVKPIVPVNRPTGPTPPGR